jgi:hypothetical protein
MSLKIVGMVILFVGMGFIFNEYNFLGFIIVLIGLAIEINASQPRRPEIRKVMRKDDALRVMLALLCFVLVITFVQSRHKPRRPVCVSQASEQQA